MYRRFIFSVFFPRDKGNPGIHMGVFPLPGAAAASLAGCEHQNVVGMVAQLQNYRLSANLNIEMYAPPAENPQDTYSEIWLTVEKIG